jgi:hypothetical protein
MSESEMMKEVWRWKEEGYQATKKMSRAERIAYFNGAARRLEETTGTKLNLPHAERQKRGAAPAKPST